MSMLELFGVVEFFGEAYRFVCDVWKLCEFPGNSTGNPMFFTGNIFLEIPCFVLEKLVWSKSWRGVHAGFDATP